MQPIQKQSAAAELWQHPAVPPEAPSSWVKRPVVLWGLVAVLAVIALGVGVARAHKTPAANATTAQDADIARVRVTVPGVRAVTANITITGSLAAQYELPVGVEGEGGKVVAIGVEAGQFVAAGQVLARLDTSVMQSQVAQIAASVEEARASARLAAADLARAVPVAESGALSRAELDRRKAAVDTSAAKVKVMEAQYREMNARLNRMAIKAPAAGKVLERHVDLGQSVAPGGPALFKIAKGGAIELRGTVAEQDMPKLAVGQSVKVSIAGVDRQWTGHVWLLGAVIDPQTRLGSVRIRLPEDPLLRPGAFARATISGETVHHPVLPQSAILTDGQGSYVFIKDANNMVVRRSVRAGTSVQGGVVVTQGLTGREAVVVSAGPFLRPGERIIPIETSLDVILREANV